MLIFWEKMLWDLELILQRLGDFLGMATFAGIPFGERRMLAKLK